MAAEEEKSKDQSEAVTNLRLMISQKEAELRRTLKNVEELKADNQRVQAMLDEERKKQEKPLDENVRLRKGMADALEKIEVYKRNWQTAQENLEQAEREKREKEQRVVGYGFEKITPEFLRIFFQIIFGCFENVQFLLKKKFSIFQFFFQIFSVSKFFLKSWKFKDISLDAAGIQF